MHFAWFYKLTEIKWFSEVIDSMSLILSQELNSYWTHTEIYTHA